MVQFSDVEMQYKNGTVALRGVSFRIDDGEFVFLVGPSGSGKSTIIKLITAEIAPTKGEIMVNGFNVNTLLHRQVPYMRRTLGVVFQNFRLIEKKSVSENLAFAMRAVGADPAEIRARISEVLRMVGLSGKQDCFPPELSGGEQQRVAIARALVNRPKMIIADEPTGNLDPARSMEIMELLQSINDMGTTVLVVTHEKDLVDRFSKRVVSINAGLVVGDEREGAYGVDPRAIQEAERRHHEAEVRRDLEELKVVAPVKVETREEARVEVTAADGSKVVAETRSEVRVEAEEGLDLKKLDEILKDAEVPEEPLVPMSMEEIEALFAALDLQEPEVPETMVEVEFLEAVPKETDTENDADEI